MKGVETIPVYADIRKGKTICVCHAGRKGCGKRTCERCTVTRDRYEEWKTTMKRDVYGK